jgi:hypothetical protein
MHCLYHSSTTDVTAWRPSSAQFNELIKLVNITISSTETLTDVNRARCNLIYVPTACKLNTADVQNSYFACKQYEGLIYRVSL